MTEIPDKKIKVGRFELVLPSDHMLDVHQGRYRLYDYFLGEIAAFLGQKYADASAIDIGANVGDSAALICKHKDMPVLAIEGHPKFYQYLLRNLSVLPSGVEPVQCLVGEREDRSGAARLTEGAGTARIETAKPDSPEAGAIPILPLSAIIAPHKKFASARLLKVDTDGADFDILLGALDFIRRARPCLFFEYDPTFRKDGLIRGLQTIEALVEVGYRTFLIYDNFGNPMARIDAAVREHFVAINRLLMSHLLFGRQIYYVDVCALTDDDADIASLVEGEQARVIDAEIGRAGWAL